MRTPVVAPFVLLLLATLPAPTDVYLIAVLLAVTVYQVLFCDDIMGFSFTGVCYAYTRTTCCLLWYIRPCLTKTCHENNL